MCGAGDPSIYTVMIRTTFQPEICLPGLIHAAGESRCSFAPSGVNVLAAGKLFEMFVYQNEKKIFSTPK